MAAETIVDYVLSLPNAAIEGKYAATESYIAQEPDEISLPQGTVVDVLKKSVEGWWTIRCVCVILSSALTC